jgi:acetyl-CoA synthetase
MIRSRIKAERSDTNLGSYEQAVKSFSWSDLEKEVHRQEGGKINIAHESIDRRLNSEESAQRTALIFEKAGEIQSFTYEQMGRISGKWANMLVSLGFEKGDRLFIYLDTCPELYFAMLACARTGVILCPLYSTLGYHELEDRLLNAQPKGILTHPDLAENLSQEIMADVREILLIQGLPEISHINVRLVDEILPEMSEDFDTVWLDPDSSLYLLYTSGSTGPPKGVVHSHGDLVGIRSTAINVLDLNEGSVLWTDGSPAWVTGCVYGAFGPWMCGAASVALADTFSASKWYRTLEAHKVNVWYTTPSTIRRLLDEGEDLPKRYDFSSLKQINTVGEALGPELFHWVRSNLGHVPHDTWWMTETGMICIANFPSMDVKPGSMGKPIPGVQAAIIDEDGSDAPMLTLGQLALKPGWPAMMKEIWRDEGRYKEYFKRPGWFLTGDMALVDEEGYYFHQGRMDDLIKMGESFVGPYEIEQLLCRHPAVHEAAVISKEALQGRPALKAFITVEEGFKPTARLNHEIRNYIKAHLALLTAIFQIEFLEELPKTRSGKLIRRVLRARELGLPGGDPVRLGD